MTPAIIGDLLSEVHHLDERVKQYDAHIKAMSKDCTAAQQLMQLMGVGQTTATAIVAMVSNGSEFASGRQFAAWIGLVPGQYSSGGKARLGRITKAGDAYLRSLLVLGARAVLNAAAGKTDSLRVCEHLTARMLRVFSHEQHHDRTEPEWAHRRTVRGLGCSCG